MSTGTQPTLSLAILQGMEEAWAGEVSPTNEQEAAYLAEKVRDFMRNRAAVLTMTASAEELRMIQIVLTQLQVIAPDHNGLASELASRI